MQADKRYQLADWRQRPLSPEMEAYARADTHYLLFIYDKMRVRRARGRGILCAHPWLRPLSPDVGMHVRGRKGLLSRSTTCTSAF